MTTNSKNQPLSFIFHVAGVKYRPDWKANLTAVKTSDLGENEIRFVGEPSNPYDSRAVKVILNDNHIGYVPSALAGNFWALHKANATPVGVLVDFQPDKEPWEIYKIQTFFKQKP